MQLSTHRSAPAVLKHVSADILLEDLLRDMISCTAGSTWEGHRSKRGESIAFHEDRYDMLWTGNAALLECMVANMRHKP